MATSDVLEVYVGVENPNSLLLRVQQRRAAYVETRGPQRVPSEEVELANAHSLSHPDFTWPHGCVTRWKGEDTSRCVAAIKPDLGRDEITRMLAGAKARGEPVLLLLEVGSRSSSRRRLQMESMPVHPGKHDYLSIRRLPIGVEPKLADSLHPADKDLALRIRDHHEKGENWLAMEAPPPGWGPVGASGTPEPWTLTPLLVDDAGEVLAATWEIEEFDARWYAVPYGSDWTQLVDWLIKRGVPAFVPQAARRIRSLGKVHEELLTSGERTANTAMAAFEAESDARRLELEEAIQSARERASGVRDLLLYGEGDDFKRGVRSILDQCGFQTEDLDQSFGSPRSADVLASLDGRHWLIEARAASGSATEPFVDDLLRHMRTWPELPRDEPIAGGVLVLNHERHKPPTERARRVYERPEFVRSLPVTVISALQLFLWWASDSCEQVRSAVTGSPAQYPAA